MITIEQNDPNTTENTHINKYIPINPTNPNIIDVRRYTQNSNKNRDKNFIYVHRNCMK